MRLLFLALAVAVTAAACADRPATPDASAGVVVDSALPTAELLARFKAESGDTVPLDTFANAAPSRDALVEDFARALAAKDTATLRERLLSRGEFAWLYYPEHPLSQPPYSMPPALMWLQAVNATGELRVALDEYGSSTYRYLGYACPDSARVAGPLRLHERCVLRLLGPARDTVENRFFGTIVERDGRFKFASYGNAL
jgi:hypothetical protein